MKILLVDKSEKAKTMALKAILKYAHRAHNIALTFANSIDEAKKIIREGRVKPDKLIVSELIDKHKYLADYRAVDSVYCDVPTLLLAESKSYQKRLQNGGYLFEEKPKTIDGYADLLGLPTSNNPRMAA